MNAKELVRFMFFSFFIIFSGIILSIYAIFVFIHRETAIHPDNILYALVLTALTTLVALVFYSRNELSNKQIIFRCMIATVIVIIIVLIAAFYFDWIRWDSYYGIVFATIIVSAVIMIMAVLMVLFKFAEYDQKSRQLAQEKQYYLSQIGIMQESAELIRTIRHDMKLHLTALKDFTEGNNGASDYLNRLLGDISASEVFSNSGNIAFDSIINFKLNQAKNDNVKLDINLLIPPTPNMEVSDIVTILGNLFDNALDAVAKVGISK